MDAGKLKLFINETLKREISITDLEKFSKYEELLKLWNSRFNLTAIKDENDVLVKHFIDSIYPLAFVDIPNGSTLLDMGSGAGFPGVPLAIMLPNVKIILVEANKKKVAFLTELKNVLSLDNIEIVNGRVENLTTYREGVDFVTARAVSQLNILLELAIPLLRVNGYFLAYKGSMVDFEIKDSKRALHLLSAEIEDKFIYSLPYINDGRSLLKIRKRKPTEKKYPRSYSLINNRPL